MYSDPHGVGSSTARRFCGPLAIEFPSTRMLVFRLSSTLLDVMTPRRVDDKLSCYALLSFDALNQQAAHKLLRLLAGLDCLYYNSTTFEPKSRQELVGRSTTTPLR
jgi:hypothetical protein